MAVGIGTDLQLSTETVAWLADQPHARELVRSVWERLAELERTERYPDTIAALRVILLHHQPLTAAGRCRTCAASPVDTCGAAVRDGDAFMPHHRWARVAADVPGSRLPVWY